ETGVRKLGAKVFYVRDEWVKISYPGELFEPGNMPQILSSIAGNVFGMKSVASLRLQDIKWPRKLIKSFLGPRLGIEGIRKLTGVKKRPLIGTIVKPKVGLHASKHAQVAYDAWMGGVDIVKDDENLSNMGFNKFDDRIIKTLSMASKAETKTGEKKIYMPNVTAETDEMIRRTKFVKKHRGTHVMVDIMTVGWAGFQTLRITTEKLGLALHAHRAGHAAIDKGDNGISMAVLASIARIIGADQLHIGTVVGKMSGSREDEMMIKAKTADRDNKAFWNPGALDQDWFGTIPVFPVCSGGLHPGHVPALVHIFGNDIIIQAGGGVHGHPDGTTAGATALRQASEAVADGIELKDFAKNKAELKKAIDKWGVAHIWD
ncbi:MAG: ribulose-bisphosphate carboxylase large subunit, partial [Candidatus Aenigmatarchaeota archaeon]